MTGGTRHLWKPPTINGPFQFPNRVARNAAHSSALQSLLTMPASGLAAGIGRPSGSAPVMCMLLINEFGWDLQLGVHIMRLKHDD